MCREVLSKPGLSKTENDLGFTKRKMKKKGNLRGHLNDLAIRSTRVDEEGE